MSEVVPISQLRREWEEFTRGQIKSARGHIERNTAEAFAGTDRRLEAIERKHHDAIHGDGNGNKGLVRRLDQLEQRMATFEEQTEGRQAEILSRLDKLSSSPPKPEHEGKPLRIHRDTIKTAVYAIGGVAAIIASQLLSRGGTDEQAATTRRMQEALTRLEQAARLPAPREPAGPEPSE